jgi:hypothetical protein
MIAEKSQPLPIGAKHTNDCEALRFNHIRDHERDHGLILDQHHALALPHAFLLAKPSMKSPAAPDAR